MASLNLISLDNSTSCERTPPFNHLSQSTSTMVHEPSSGEEILSISRDDGLLSAEKSTTNVSVAQTDKEPESNSINSGLESQSQAGLGPTCNPTKLFMPQTRKKNSIGISMPQCLKVPQVAENVEVGSLMTPSDLMQLYQHNCSHMNVAAKLSVKLFDMQINQVTT